MKKKSRKSSSRSLSKTNSPVFSPRPRFVPRPVIVTGLVPPPPPSAFKDLKKGVRKLVHYTSSSDDLDIVITNTRKPKNEVNWRRHSQTRSIPGQSNPRGIHYRPREASIYTINACPRVRLPPSYGPSQSQKKSLAQTQRPSLYQNRLKGQGQSQDQGCKVKVVSSASTSSSLKSVGQRRRKKAKGKPPTENNSQNNLPSTTSIQTAASFAHLIVPPPPPLNITTFSSLNLSQPFSSKEQQNNLDSGDRQSFFQQGAKYYPNLTQKAAATAQLSLDMQLQMSQQQQQQNQCFQQQQQKQQQQFISQIPSLPPLVSMHNDGSTGDSKFVNQLGTPVGGSGDDFNYLNKMEQDKSGQIPFGNFLPQISQQNFTVMPLHYNYFNNQNQSQQQQPQTQGQQQMFPNGFGNPTEEQQRTYGGVTPRFNGFPFCPPPPPIDPEDFPSFQIPQYREFLNMNEALPANSARPFDEALRDEVRRRLLQILNGAPDRQFSTDGNGLFNSDSKCSEMYSNLADNPGSLYDNLSNASSFHSISNPIPPPPSSISKDSSKASVRAQNSKESYWIPEVHDKTNRIIMDTTRVVNKQLASDLPNYVVKNAKEAKKFRRPQPAGARKIVDDARGSKTTPLPKLIGGPGFGQVPTYIKRRKVEIQIEKFRRLESEWRDALLNLHEEARKWRKNQEEKRAKARQQARRMRNYQKMQAQQQTLLVRDQVTGRLIHVPLSQCIGKHRDSADFNSNASGKCNARESTDRMKKPANSRTFQMDNIFIGPYKSSTSLGAETPEKVKNKESKELSAQEEEEEEEKEEEEKVEEEEDVQELVEEKPSKKSLKLKKKKSSGKSSKKSSTTSTEQPEDQEEEEVPLATSVEDTSDTSFLACEVNRRRAISLPCVLIPFPEPTSSENMASFSSEEQLGIPSVERIPLIEELEDSMGQGDAEILHMNNKCTTSSEEEVDDEFSDEDEERNHGQETETELDLSYLRRCKSANDL